MATSIIDQGNGYGTVVDNGEDKSPRDEVEDIVSKFLILQTGYADRNSNLAGFSNLFRGEQWLTEPTDDQDYQLTLNYLRNVTLRFASILSRIPKPAIPIPTVPTLADQASRREKFLLSIWPDLMRAWRDVEMNSSKMGFGVLQALWHPIEGEPQSVNMGIGEDKQMQRAYTKSPFLFRSIPPMNFYPMFRTFDTPNDFLYVFRYEPNRSVRDLEVLYGVKLQTTGLDETMTEPTVELIEYWDAAKYKLIALSKQEVRVGGTDRRPKVETMTVYQVLEEGANPYKSFPFWILQNIRSDPNVDPTNGGSLSDIEDLIESQKHFNEMVSEQATEISTNIHRPLVYQSADHQADPASLEFKAGAVFPIGPKEDESLEPLDYKSPGPEVQTHLETIMQSIKDLSFLGDAGFGQLSSGVSGVGFGIALNPLQQITELKVPLRVECLRGVCAYLLECFEKKADKDAAFMGWHKLQSRRFESAVLTPSDIAGNYYTDIVYGNLLPRDDYAHDQNEVYLFKTGAQSLYTTLDHLGYEDPQAELDRIKLELQDPVLNPEQAMLIAQAKSTAQPQSQQQPQPQGQPQLPGRPARPMQQPGQMGQQSQQAGGMQQPSISQGPPVPPGGVGGGPGMGGFGGIAGVPGGMPGTQGPPVPNAQAFPRRPGEPQIPGMPAGGPGINAPFLRRRNG